MKLKQVWGNRVWDCDSTEDLVRGCVSIQSDSAVQDLADIISRMLDAMPLTEQQKLDIVSPYGPWEITTGEPK